MIHNFWLFALASFLLNITPGNDMLYVISRSAGQGVRAGIISSLGIMTGCLVHLICAAAGLSAILAGSATAFSIVKYAGACYLVYLGLKAILSKKAAGLVRVEKPVAASGRRIFWQGVLTNVLNPKVALFFLAFLPQFIEIHGGHAQVSILLLGAWFDIGGTMVNITVAVLFGRIGDYLKRSPRWLMVQEKLTGLVLIALGIKVALTSKK
jgi:threonine/homoserine/homoserine lactone efflux protein